MPIFVPYADLCTATVPLQRCHGVESGQHRHSEGGRPQKDAIRESESLLYLHGVQSNDRSTL